MKKTKPKEKGNPGGSWFGTRVCHNPAPKEDWVDKIDKFLLAEEKDCPHKCRMNEMIKIIRSEIEKAVWKERESMGKTDKFAFEEGRDFERKRLAEEVGKMKYKMDFGSDYWKRIHEDKQTVDSMKKVMALGYNEAISDILQLLK